MTCRAYSLALLNRGFSERATRVAAGAIRCSRREIPNGFSWQGQQNAKQRATGPYGLRGAGATVPRRDDYTIISFVADSVTSG